MNGTQTTVDEKLEIPKLESSRGRKLTALVGFLVLSVTISAYLLLRSPDVNPYRLAPVTRTSIVKEIRLTGHLELNDQVEVPAPIAGQLIKVFVQPGDSVEQGQVLAQLDKASAESAFEVASAELEAARARVSEAEASAQRASEVLKRTESLKKKDLASASAMESARSEMAKARAVAQGARAERSAAQDRASMRKLERERTDVRAPRAGLVLEVPPRTGMIVNPQTRLFRIGAPVDEMKIAAPVGEADIGEIKVGLGAKFEVPTYPGRVFEATVKHISPDSYTRYGAVFYDVTLTTQNPDHVLLPGMTAQVRIKVAEVDDVLAVREATLRFVPEGAPSAPARSRVWRVKGKQIEAIPVEAGLSDGAFTEIRPSDSDSIKIGDEVAIGYALDGKNETAAPSLSLRGHR